MKKTKSFDISKQLVMKAWTLVKANRGGAGVDGQTLQDFEVNLKDNLYKIWNRLSSGCYFPPMVKTVVIPKKKGKKRELGVPTVSDRVAQMVVKLKFEPKAEKIFLPDSYGYRPNKSAIEAVRVTRKRCWQYDWVVEFDIKGLFDNIPHDLLMKAVHKHTTCKWELLYIRRWLTVPKQGTDGRKVRRTKGTPQGGVISPVLSNLYLHYVFDEWMRRNNPTMKWCRYADDGLVHCSSKEQAKQVMKQLGKRFKACGLELHPLKTKIVYCKDGNRKEKYTTKTFDFLGYTFRARRCMNSRKKECFAGFNPAVSKSAMKAMRAKLRSLRWKTRATMTLEEIAKKYNPILRGWINYYGAFQRSALYPMIRYFNQALVRWARNRYKRFRHNKTKTIKAFLRIAKERRNLFVHWEINMLGAFA